MAISDFWKDRDVNNLDNAMLMARTKTAISNFVQIISQRNDIRVDFKSRDESYTDGKSVVLSAKQTDLRKFDAAAGLALHEGSHIMWSDFTELKQLTVDLKSWEHTRMYVDRYELHNNNDHASSAMHSSILQYWLNDPGMRVIRENKTNNNILKRLFDYYMHYSNVKDVIESMSLTESNRVYEFMHTRLQYFKTILNIIEDRRIDALARRTAPGYAGYYQAMYKAYFQTRSLNKKLKENSIKTETWESYQFHLIHLINDYFNPSALIHLQSIVDLIDLPTIHRIATMNDVLDLSWKIFDIIARACDREQDLTNDVEMKSSTSTANGNDTADLADEIDAATKNDINKIVDVINGDIVRKPVAAKTYRQYKALSESDVQTVYSDYVAYNGNRNVHVPVHVLNTFNKTQIESGIFHGMCANRSRVTFIDKTINTGNTFLSSNILEQLQCIEDGYDMGRALARKLQTRDEERTLKYTRLPKGKIDRRLIHQLGYQSENVFQHVEVQRSKTTNIHLSIDASASMHGDRFNNALKTAIAIARAAELIETMHVQISLRGTVNDLTLNNSNRLNAMLWIVYDSKKSISVREFANLARYLYPNSYTPEGLCFTAISKQYVLNSNEDNYFINLSDGQPYIPTILAQDENKQTLPGYYAYVGDPARMHTRNEVKKLIKSGWTVHGIFITGNTASAMDQQAFKYMYGMQSKFITDADLNQLATALNAMFQRNITDFSC